MSLQSNACTEIVGSESDKNELLLFVRQVFYSALGFQPSVRFAINSDRHRILDFIRSIRNEYDTFVPPDLERDLNDLESSYSSRGGFVLLVENGRSLLGTFAFLPISNDVGEVRKIYLDKHVRGFGIGLSTLELILRYARKRGIRVLRAETNHRLPGYHLFKKIGFQSSGKSSALIGHSFLPEDGILMEYVITKASE
jgi:GNAT superfamily N-acetyltransferase